MEGTPFSCLLSMQIFLGNERDKYKLGIIPEARNRCIICQPAAHDKPFFMEPLRIFRKKPLTGCKYAFSSDSPLTAVCMPGDCQVDARIPYVPRIILRMMT